jgi:TonB family protein
MSHGSREYFLERARSDRRVSLVTAGVSLALLALQIALTLPSVRLAVERRLGRDPAELKRFGFEGREQYVQRIILETAGPVGPDPGRPTILYRSAQSRKGGRDPARSSDDPHARPDTRRVGTGAGESTADLVAQARVLYGGSALVMRSEDLIIERLVKPEYPTDARDRDIQGVVALVAVVDTTGAVERVDLISSPGEKQLEEAATAAVMQCHFRPYRQNGRLTEVHAVFRFRFKIY